MADELTTQSVADTGTNAAAAPETQTLIGGTGDATPAPAAQDTSGGDPWYSGANAELLTDKIKSFKSQDDLLKSYTESQKLNGKKGLIPPGAEATDEEKAAFRAQLQPILGVPESPDGYEYTPPEGVNIDEEAFAKTKQEFHEAGFTQEQFAKTLGLYERELATAQANVAAQQAALQEEGMALLTERTGGDADKALAMVQREAQASGHIDRLSQDGLLNHPVVADLLFQLAQAKSEGTVHGDLGARSTIDEAIKTVRSSVEYTDSRHAGHRAAVERLDALYQQRGGRG